MQVVKYPGRTEWPKLLKRPIMDTSSLEETVGAILKEVKEKEFKIDKANFYAAGWFKFELYEDGKLIEKNKFKIGSEF